ncbi:DUF1659 domain-containing protein [Dethiothermospora halolimnae]|uniref:DUF1659 domain-containing protein n=1 Tax=Dethiothermospora halolimnae TaxID=3114390 RepID=UPI003CCBB49F
MALDITNKDSKLRIRFDGGLDDKGKQILKSKTYSKIKPETTDDDIYGVATSLTGLQNLPLMSVTRVNEVELAEA